MFYNIGILNDKYIAISQNLKQINDSSTKKLVVDDR